MGRTVPSFRYSHMAEEAEWKPFRNNLDRPDRKAFDQMFASSRLYVSACMSSARPIRIQPIMMSIVFHHYKQLAGLTKKMEAMLVEPVPG